MSTLDSSEVREILVALCNKTLDGKVEWEKKRNSAGTGSVYTLDAGESKLLLSTSDKMVDFFVFTIRDSTQVIERFRVSGNENPDLVDILVRTTKYIDRKIMGYDRKINAIKNFLKDL